MRNKRNEVRKAGGRRVGLVNRSESGEKKILLSFAQQEIHHPLTGFQHAFAALRLRRCRHPPSPLCGSGETGAVSRFGGAGGSRFCADRHTSLTGLVRQFTLNSFHER
jgi:hypothetical protein